MQELSERTGLPKTTIHHYIRENLLPPAHKTAPNAAEYDEGHLDRLRLISRLRDGRDGDAGGFSIPRIRRILAHVEAGLSVRGAVRLVEADIEAEAPGAGGWSSAQELASAAAVPIELIEALTAAGLIAASAAGSYAPGDLLVARACHALQEDHGIDPRDVAPVADLIREVGNYSDTLIDVHAATSGSRDDSVVDRQRLRDQLAECCRALLWRALEGGPDPGLVP